ncbi:MAG TPA: hypothetical protein VK602_13390 [Phyllobacterium sp.]|nr:hypothetical protein [Phyllobacterium sp.]
MNSARTQTALVTGASGGIAARSRPGAPFWQDNSHHEPGASQAGVDFVGPLDNEEEPESVSHTQ